MLIRRIAIGFVLALLVVLPVGAQQTTDKAEFIFRPPAAASSGYVNQLTLF